MTIGLNSFANDIPYPFQEIQKDSRNQIQLLERGEEALEARLNLISRAKESIDVEYYIYNTDLAGKIFTRELVKAAQRGVKVRILVDKLMALSGLSSYHAKVFNDYGIELKYYNTALLIKVSTIHYRNHRKLLVIDGKEAITGGRNIGNDYYNLDHKFNFEDRDVLIKGPIVKSMKDSFEAFFDNKISHHPNIPRIPHGTRAEDLKRRQRYEKLLKKAQDFLSEGQEELLAREEIKRIAELQSGMQKTYACPEITFTSDAPGANFVKSISRNYRENFRHLRKTFKQKLNAVDKELTISSPYFIANDKYTEILDNLLERGTKVSIYTNSLNSTDAVFVASNFYLHLSSWLKKGMNMFLHDGKWSGGDEPVMEGAREKDWGTHSKTQIFETSAYSEVMIGTYNMDNRSDYYNTELAVFCKGNDEFTNVVKNKIMGLSQNGFEVKSMRSAIDRDGNEIKDVTGAGIIDTLTMNLVTLPSWLIDHLL